MPAKGTLFDADYENIKIKLIMKKRQMNFTIHV